MADRVELTVIQVRANDRWQAVAVIDGRRYPDRASYDQAVMDAFSTMNGSDVPSQFESRDVTPDEEPWPLPTWDEYWEILATKGARGTA